MQLILCVNFVLARSPPSPWLVPWPPPRSPRRLRLGARGYRGCACLLDARARHSARRARCPCLPFWRTPPGRRAAEAFVRAGAPVISGCFAMALGLAPLLACQHEEARKFAIAISMLAACIGLWIGLFLPALLSPWVRDGLVPRSIAPSPGGARRAARAARRWISPSGATPGSTRWVWSDGGCATSPRLRGPGEALSGVPASARRLTLSARRPISGRRPSSSAGRATLGVVAAANASSLAQVVPSRQRRPWPRSSVAKREGLPRADSLSWRRLRASGHEQAVRPPTRRTNLLLSGTSLLARVQRTQKHAARQQRLRATPASTEAVAMVGVGALRSRGRSRPNLLAPAAAPDGGRQARAAYR